KEQFQVNTGRLIGIILIGIGLGVAALAGLFIAVQANSGLLEAGGAVLGAGLAFIPVALLVGFGIYMYVQGGQEAAEESVMQKQRQLLDILKSRGQVSVSEMAVEMQVSADTIK